MKMLACSLWERKMVSDVTVWPLTGERIRKEQWASPEPSVGDGRARPPGAPPSDRPAQRSGPTRLLAVLLAFLASFSLLPAANLVEPSDPNATFFMGRVRYSNNDGNDCGGVGQELMRLVSRVSTIKVQQEKRVRLVDPELFETPFLFMNGHNDFVLRADELEALRKYFSHGGFLFISGCCTNPDFPKAARREFARLFSNEKVKELAYDHPIYRSFYLITRVRSLHENKDIHLEGLFYQGNLVMVMCEDGLCCAFSMANRCNPGKGVSSEDGPKLALNIAVYSITH